MENNNEKETGIIPEKENENENRVCLYSDDESWYCTEEAKAEYHECAGLEDDEEIDEEAYWSWVADFMSVAFDDFRHECNRSLEYRPVIIMGTLGLWNGRPEIEPVIVKDDAENCALICAVLKCARCSGDTETEVWLEKEGEDAGTISVSVAHHDGRNSFTIRLLAKGQEDLIAGLEYGEDEEYRYADLKYEPFTTEMFGF